MPKFSQRHGYTPVEKAFQREVVDQPLRVKLWNVLKLFIWDDYDHGDYHKREKSILIDEMIRRLWFHYFNKDMDSLPEFADQYRKTGAYSQIKEFFFSCEWYEVYDFLEELSHDRSNLVSAEVKGWINRELEKHNAAYRYVGNEIAEITDEIEIKAIEDGLDYPEKPVRLHLDAALKMLCDKELPDYRNSIKESISAVEAACRLTSGNNSASLGDALKRIENVHPALLKAFGLLYGYTSDASGIRHSLIDEPNITYADAKFMLVGCSAFVSYLKASAKNV